MASFQAIVARSVDEAVPATTVNALIALLVLVLVAVLVVAALLCLRHYRRSKTSFLPIYQNEKSGTKRSNHHRISGIPITARTRFGRPLRLPISNHQEKQDLLASSPPSPIPEIRITFPEEVDESGKRQSGRVVVVHVGEKEVGMEPHEECLPSYQRDANDRFQSLDLERIGGLKEKRLVVE